LSARNAGRIAGRGVSVKHGQRELVAVLDLPLRTLARRKRASAVVPVERNYLINPVHPQSHQVRVGKAEAFSLDPRMWK